MSDVDDAIRDELARLVRPADTAAVMAAVAARRDATGPEGSKGARSWLVAAAVIAVLGLVGLGLVSSRSEEPSVTASADDQEVPRLVPSLVPGGAALVSVHEFPADDWSTPPNPWARPGRYTLHYADLTHPGGEPSFILEVFPDTDLDVDAALAGWSDQSVTTRVGGAAGVRLREPDSPYDQIIWQVGTSVVSMNSTGISAEEVLAIAASVRSVDAAMWAAALTGADIAPPYGFRGETTVVSGDGWTITAGMYRHMFGTPTGCAVLDIDRPNPGDPEPPSCVSPYPVPESLRTGLGVDVRHVWVDGRLLVWGVPLGTGRSVRLVYDEGTFEASPGQTDGPFRVEPIPGTDTFVFAAELEVAREPSRVEVVDGSGTIISAYEDLTPRTLPPVPSGMEPRAPVPKAEEGQASEPGGPGAMKGVTATGASWELAVDGPVPCLSVQVGRAAPVSACLGDAPSTDDPYRVGLLDEEGVPRFLFGAALPDTAKVTVELMDGVEVEGGLEDGSVTAPADGTAFYALELSGRADGALVEFFDAGGTRLSGRGVESAPDAPFTLVISNQSFEEPEVFVTVRVDGREVVDDAFRVESQHTFVSFPMDLVAGDHLLEAQTDDGVTVSGTFTVPADKPHFATLFYWTADDGDPGSGPAARPLPGEGYFQLSFNDHEFHGE